MEELGVSERDMAYASWDLVLSKERKRSGKNVLVEKTQRTAIDWKKVTQCLPNARYIFLLRHPASIAASWKDAKPKKSDEDIYSGVLKYMNAVEAARENLGDKGVTVRYEDITNDPAYEMQRLCEFIGVNYEEDMIEYGKKVDMTSRFKRGISDWTGKIKSRKVQKGRRAPEANEVPKPLRAISKKWGYID